MNTTENPVQCTLIAPGEIDAIRQHLEAGGEIFFRGGFGPLTLLKRRHVEYIHASKDGKGYLLGWPGKRKSYVMPGYLYRVPLGWRINRKSEMVPV